MIGIQTSLYLVAVALCVFCTGLKSRGRSFSYFSAFLFIQSGTFLCELLMAHPATPLKSLWLGLLMSGSLLLAPCLWLAFHESVGGARHEWRALPRAHGWVIATGFVFTLPLMLNAHLGTTFEDPLRPTSWLHARFIHTTMLLCIGIFVVQVPWYLVRCRRMLLARLGGRSGPVFRQSWAELPLAIVLTTWALAILRTLNCAFIKWPPMFSLIVAVISVGITVGALYLLLRKFAPEDEAQTKPPAGDVALSVAGESALIGQACVGVAAYAKSPLGDAQRERIRRKIENSLSRDSIYKRSDLTLRTLSETLNESPHYVSQVISQDLDTSFYELLNAHRVEEAKRLLRELPAETVLAIAMNVGFNSKSAFHAAFRRCTGITPTEFRQSTPD